MLSITRIADYAIIAMTDLASHYPAQVKMRDISERTCIPQPTLQKIMSALVSRKLVCSIRGPDGGYYLSRPAEEITFFDVVTAVEGPFRLTKCAGNATGPTKGDCGMKRVCRLVGPMRKVHSLLGQLLAGVSIAQLAEDTVPEILTLEPSPKRKRRRATKASR